ncbi:MAG: imidazole glycerol phosphate synthase subunit HisH [Fusobacteriaceae bacterium]|nr:imidazole glycerol phosphate synthase subunit HisH [Fusobacteriaceae bacterium]MBN2837891.1 imidazole glycerol phosphate synthase subunit HisH [Fusobacteriaceae bacterium]
MIVIIDYGVGNLHSIKSALDYLKIENKVSKDIDEILNADGLILPGVGAFGDAMENLTNTGLIPTIRKFVESGKKLLGICLGAQLLYEKSFELGEYEGLGFIKGEVIPFKGLIDKELKIPHMGWNELIFNKNDKILKYIKEKEQVYYVHSYFIKSEGTEVIASSEYDINVPGIVCYENIYGMQFHPEKSGITGLNLLKAFGELI